MVVWWLLFGGGGAGLLFLLVLFCCGVVFVWGLVGFLWRLVLVFAVFRGCGWVGGGVCGWAFAALLFGVVRCFVVFGFWGFVCFLPFFVFLLCFLCFFLACCAFFWVCLVCLVCWFCFAFGLVWAVLGFGACFCWFVCDVSGWSVCLLRFGCGCLFLWVLFGCCWVGFVWWCGFLFVSVFFVGLLLLLLVFFFFVLGLMFWLCPCAGWGGCFLLWLRGFACLCVVGEWFWVRGSFVVWCVCACLFVLWALFWVFLRCGLVAFVLFLVGGLCVVVVGLACFSCCALWVLSVWSFVVRLAFLVGWVFLGCGGVFGFVFVCVWFFCWLFLLFCGCLVIRFCFVVVFFGLVFFFFFWFVFLVVSGLSVVFVFVCVVFGVFSFLRCVVFSWFFALSVLCLCCFCFLCVDCLLFGWAGMVCGFLYLVRGGWLGCYLVGRCLSFFACFLLVLFFVFSWLCCFFVCLFVVVCCFGVACFWLFGVCCWGVSLCLGCLVLCRLGSVSFFFVFFFWWVFFFFFLFGVSCVAGGFCVCWVVLSCLFCLLLLFRFRFFF